jgi:hypothetical protein
MPDFLWVFCVWESLGWSAAVAGLEIKSLTISKIECNCLLFHILILYCTKLASGFCCAIKIDEIVKSHQIQ